MRKCTVNERRAKRARATVCVVAIAALVTLGTAGTGPAAAAEFEIGEVRGHVDTTVSAGASMRVQDRDCSLIHVTNGGCSEEGVFLNSDDGNLNYGQWDVFANTYKASVDVELAWKNFGGFFRGSVFYDFVTMNTNTERTNLERDALYRSSPINSGVVGMGYQLLDAYLYGNFDVASRPVDIRVGNQVLSWGESLFYQGGVSSINTVDLNRLRAPGSQLKEAFLPAPMVRVSAELFRNFSVEAFYQMYWNYTQLDPVGSYFSANDLVGRAAEASYALYDPGIQDAELAQVARELSTIPEPVWVDPAVIQAAAATGSLPTSALVEDPHLPGATPRNLPRTTEEMAETVYAPLAPFQSTITPPTGDPVQDATVIALNALGYFPTNTTFIRPFTPFAIPRMKDEKPSSQGQWGVALRYFWEAIRTEFGAYYIRIHDKVPSVGWVAEPTGLTIASFIRADEWGPLAPLIPPENLPPNPADLRTAQGARPVGYFREYPEKINVYGLSAATELFGIAWGAEVSYQTQKPVPRNGELLLREVLAEVAETGQRIKRSGYSRERRLQAQLNAIATIGPGDPYLGAIVRALRISSIAATVEVAAVKFPSLDSDNFYQPTNNGGEVDELSWGYQTLITGFYDNPFGIPITVAPRIGFSHDVDGNTPGFYPFIEHRKSLAVGVNVDYLGVWQFDLSYTNWFGAQNANMLNDRDYVSLSVTRSF
jgi:hypothetical protein